MDNLELKLEDPRINNGFTKVLNLPLHLDPSSVDVYKPVHDWIRNIRGAGKKSKLVARNGLYVAKNLEGKFETSPEVIKLLLKSGVLRMADVSGKGHKQNIQVDSVAELMSGIYNTPVSQTILEKSKYDPKIHEYKPREHILKLWDAYSGDFWFENFRDEQKNRNTKLPIVCEWHLLPKDALSGELAISKKRISELEEYGFLIPRNGEFKAKSSGNLVEPVALAQLYALLDGEFISKKLKYTSEDITFARIRQEFINTRVVPALEKYNIDPIGNYQINRAGMKLGLSDSKIRSWIFSNNGVPYKQVPFQGNRTRTVVKGIDLVLRVLRETGKKQLTGKEVTDFFGIRSNQIDYLHLPKGTNGLYGTAQYINPLYDLFASNARSHYFRKRANPLELGPSQSES